MPKRLVDGEGIWRSQKLRQLKLEYRSEYANLLPLAGDRGSFECDPASIWADVYAYNRPDITPEEVEAILAEFERVKLLFRWPHEGKTWGYWIGIEKAGLLPKPSERYSKDPIPTVEDITRFLGGSPALHPPDTRATPALLPRTGLGLGIGSGSGSGFGSGEETSSSLDNNNKTEIQKQDQDQKQNQNQNQPQMDPLTIGAIQAVMVNEFPPEFVYKSMQEGDPLLPLLVRLTEERLEIYKEEKGINLDAQHPELPLGTKGFTPREASVSAAKSGLKYALQMLWVTDQYIKLAVPDRGFSGLEFSDEHIKRMMNAIGWPNLSSEVPGWEEMTLARYGAILNWAFRVSKQDWRTELKSLDDIIKNMKVLGERYDKYYAHAKEGNKPHNHNVGLEVLMEDVNDL